MGFSIQTNEHLDSRLSESTKVQLCYNTEIYFMLILSQLNVYFRTHDTKFYLLSPLNPQKSTAHIFLSAWLYMDLFSTSSTLLLGCKAMNYKELYIQKFNQKQLHARINQNISSINFLKDHSIHNNENSIGSKICLIERNTFCIYWYSPFPT